MKIGVLSDTHDRLPEAVVLALKEAEEIWHLGDVCAPATLTPLHHIGVPLRVVRGNCDSGDIWPEQIDLLMEGLRIRLVHIPPKNPPEGFDLILHGHTHVPRNEVLHKIRFLNPGCITRPNRGAPASFAWLEFNAAQPPQWTLVRC
jgi:putative phosphoesterase